MYAESSSPELAIALAYLLSAKILSVSFGKDKAACFNESVFGCWANDPKTMHNSKQNRKWVFPVRFIKHKIRILTKTRNNEVISICDKLMRQTFPSPFGRTCPRADG